MIYFDNASTTKPGKQVTKKVKEVLEKSWGNPSSSHQIGQKASKALEDSRQTVASFLNCQPNEIIFTSSGSEANNLAVKGLLEKLKQENSKGKIELITTQFEHKSLLKSAAYIKNLDGFGVSYLKPNKDGLINPKQVKKAIGSKTRLVSIIYLNNEVGTIQPIREIGKMIEKVNRKRKKNKIYFHTDAVQASNYLKMDYKYLHVDLLSLSGHKIKGPKGVGILLKKEDVSLLPLISGGGQEMSLRAGTENTAYCAGLATAIRNLDQKKGRKKVNKLRKYFEKKLKEKIEDVKINCQKGKRGPHISSIVFPQAEGESIMLALDLAGIAVSTGSACNSAQLKASHVLEAIGLSPEEAQSTVRFSFSKNNSKKEVDKVIKELTKIIPKLKKMSPQL